MRHFHVVSPTCSARSREDGADCHRDARARLESGRVRSVVGDRNCDVS